MLASNLSSPTSSTFRSGASSPLITTTIMPYLDPEYGERPSYQRSKGSRLAEEHKLAQQQDEIMTDAYENFGNSGTEGEDGGAPVPELHD